MPHQLPHNLASKRIFPQLTFGLFLLLATVTLGGCGSKDGPARVPVGGTIRFDDVPLRSGTIRFIPMGTTQGPSAVATVKDGVYRLTASDGPIVGTHRVEIEATALQNFALDDEQAYARQAEQGGVPLPPNPIPPIYNRQSTLQRDLPAEGNLQLDFQLTSQP
ncbi:MAG: hypothetical protein EHM42_00520 [Planctomycetaceae bacterium]|nr:MAG: hypothetical protein EHM42_00520 [Planctomycetaceae bacterium]